MAAKFVIKKAKNGQYYFNLKAGNGETILTSEMYKAKASANNGIQSVKKASLTATARPTTPRPRWRTASSRSPRTPDRRRSTTSRVSLPRDPGHPGPK